MSSILSSINCTILYQLLRMIVTRDQNKMFVVALFFQSQHFIMAHIHSSLLMQCDVRLQEKENVNDGTCISFIIW